MDQPRVLEPFQWDKIMNLRKIILALALVAVSAPALSQAVQQSGSITPNSVPRWVSNGVIGGGVSANNSPITSFGVTSNSTAGICSSSGLPTAAGRQQLCLGAPLSGPAQISLQNYGTAAPQDLQIVVNGAVVSFADIASPNFAMKQPADLATTTNITLSGEQVIDGVLTSNSRVLVKNQSVASQNGIYNSQAGAWTRAPDFSVPSGQAVPGTQIYITGGSTNATLVYAISTPGPIVIGSTNIAFIVAPGFIQAGAGAVTRTMQDKVRATLDVKDFGAKGDGVTDDTSAFNAAITQCAAQGGADIIVRPTGAAYVLSNVAVGTGCQLVGARIKPLVSSTATQAQATSFGTWVKCTDLVNPCMTAAGNGSGIVGFVYWHDQPIPSGGSWAPTIYPYTVLATGTLIRLEDLWDYNGSHGISNRYTGTSGGGTFSVLKNLFVASYKNGFDFVRVNDIENADNLKAQNTWYETDSRVVAYMETIGNGVGMVMQYVDNMVLNGYEAFKLNCGVKFIDDTVLGNTHAAVHMQWTNIQFNLVSQATCLGSTNPTITGTWSTVLMQTDTETGAAQTAFEFGTDNIDMTLVAVTIPAAGASGFNVGNSGSGKLHIDGLNVTAYGTGGTGFALFGIGNNATIDLANFTIPPTPGAGNSLKVGGGTLQSQAAGPQYIGLIGNQGQVILNGATSGAVIQTTQSVAGAPTVTWGTSTGTPAVTASSPLVITTGTGNIACTTCVTTAGGQSIAGLTVTGSFTATGLVTNADLANSSVAVNGTTCTLGSTCSPFSALAVGSTTILSGTATRILYDNAGVLGEYTLSGSGTVVAMASGPAFTAASTTTLNLTGATIPVSGVALYNRTGASLSVGIGGSLYYEFSTASFVPGQSGLSLGTTANPWAGVVLTGASPATGAGQIGYGGATVAAGSGNCPTGTVGTKTVAGCLSLTVAGSPAVVPYF